MLELETQLYIALDLHYIEESQFRELHERSSEVQKLLNGLIHSMR